VKTLRVVKAKPGCMWGYDTKLFGGILGMLKNAKGQRYRLAYGGWTPREADAVNFETILRIEIVDSSLVEELICDK
jgi:hypothetical protein